jgi:putative hydrolase
MSQEPWGDIPLFREIQRILASSEGGPVNFEIARQVATAIATQGATDAAAPAAEGRAYGDAVRASEEVVAGYSRLGLVEPATTKLIGRAEWASSTLTAWRWLLEHLATRFTGDMGRLTGNGEDEAGAMQASMGQVAPLLMGIQTGTLVGHLAKESLGRYDLPIPRDDDGRLFLVTPNVYAVAADYGFEIDPFYRWLALHEVARHVIATSVTWIVPYFRSQLTEVIDAIEIDVSDLERRLIELQSGGAEALQSGLGIDQGLPIVETERHRRALDRFHAFVALFEGYGAHVAEAVSQSLVSDATKIDEGMARRGVSSSEGEAMLSGILGISVDRDLEASGKTFCAAIVKLKGLAALNRVWEAPDNLPTIEEIRDPFAWIDRLAE